MAAFIGRAWFRAQIAPYLQTIKAAIAAGGGGDGGASTVPTFANANLVVMQNTQVLFAEPITVADGFEIVIESGAVLREVS